MHDEQASPARGARSRRRGPPTTRLVLVLQLCRCTLCDGFGFTVEAGKVECFEEAAKSSERVSGDWHVQDGSHELDVTVTSPSGEHVYAAEREMQGSFAFYASTEGTYTVCFSNERTEKGTHEHDREVVAKLAVGEPPDMVALAKAEHLSPVEERIKNLHKAMIAVRDLQDQIREQDEQRHHVTQSTRSWLLYFTVIEAIVLVAVSLWQILYLKSFFEVRRVV